MRYRFGVHSWLIWVALLGGIVMIWWTFWQRYTESVPWVAAILGLLLFSLPGMSVFHLLYQDRPKSLFSYLIVGFAVSNGVVGCAGMAARVLHLPFAAIIASLVVVGWFGWMWAFVQWREHGAPVLRFRVHFSPVDLLFLLLMVVMVGFAIRFSLSRASWAADDNRYGAYLTNWQYSDSLDFNDVILDIESPIDPRFWIAHFPLTEAALSDLSGLHGVKWIGIYLEPLLITLSLLAVYELAKALDFSTRWSVVAVLVHVLTLVYLIEGSKWERPGTVFFRRLSEDKSVVAFLLCPLFLRLIIDFTKKKDWRSFALLLIVGLGIMFTHPTLLAAVILVVGVYAVLELIIRRNVRTFIWIVILAGLLVGLPFTIRFFASDSAGRPFSPEEALSSSVDRGHTDELNFVADGEYYGANPDILLIDMPNLPRFQSLINTLEPVLEITIWVLIVIAGIIALLEVRQRAVARLILAVDALLFVTFFPYTGWILGFFISPFHLIRIPWIFPFGIAFIYIGYYFDRVAMVRMGSNKLRYSLAGLGVIALVFGFLWPFRVRLQAPLDWQQQFNSLATLGEIYDVHQPQSATVMGIPIGINDQLPTISPLAKLFVMAAENRTSEHGVSKQEAKARFAAWGQITNTETPTDERLALLDQYNVRYIFVHSEQAVQWVIEVADSQPENYKILAREGPFILYQVQSQSAYSPGQPPAG